MSLTEELGHWVRTNCPAELVGSTFKYGGGSHQEITDPANRNGVDAVESVTTRTSVLGFHVRSSDFLDPNWSDIGRQRMASNRADYVDSESTANWKCWISCSSPLFARTY